MTRRQALVVIALAVLALATVAVAATTHSAVPLFFGWLPQLLIIVYMSRSDRKLAAAAESPEGPAAPTEADAPPPADHGV